MDFSTHLPRATSVITRAAQSKSNRDLKQSGFATIKTRALQGSYRGLRAGIEILLCLLCAFGSLYQTFRRHGLHLRGGL